jgi:hypothetical protein
MSKNARDGLRENLVIPVLVLIALPLVRTLATTIGSCRVFLFPLLLVHLRFEAALRGSLPGFDTFHFGIVKRIGDDCATLDRLSQHGSWSLGRHGERLPEISADPSAHSEGVVQSRIDRTVTGRDSVLGRAGEILVLTDLSLRKPELEILARAVM